MNSATMDIPRCQVHLLCRVCGHRLMRKASAGHQETTYSCATFSAELKSCFEIEISNDTADVPTSFCKSCRLAMSRIKEASDKKIPFKCMVKPYNWSLHCSSTCKVNIFIHMYDLIWLIICTHTYTSI